MRYEPDDIVIDDTKGGWYAAYNAGEGFQPWILLVRADSASDAETVYMEHERHRCYLGVVPEQLVIEDVQMWAETDPRV